MPGPFDFDEPQPQATPSPKRERSKPEKSNNGTLIALGVVGSVIMIALVASIAGIIIFKDIRDENRGELNELQREANRYTNDIIAAQNEIADWEMKAADTRRRGFEPKAEMMGIARAKDQKATAERRLAIVEKKIRDAVK